MVDVPAPAPTSASMPASAQTPSDPPELARLKIEKAISDQEAAIAENRRKSIASTLPSDVKALDGTTKIDGDHPIESQILAYRALDGLAKKISDTIAGCVPPPTSVIIHGEAEINALLALQAFNARIDLIDKQLNAEIANADRVLKDTEAATRLSSAPMMGAADLALAPMVIGGVLRSAADLLSLFRVNVALKYKDLTINDMALAAAVVGHLALRPNPIPAYYPAMVPPKLDDKTSSIGVRLEQLALLRGKMDGLQEDMTKLQARLKKQIEDLTATVDAAAAAAGKPNAPTPEQRARDAKQRASDQMTATAARLQAASAAFDTFQGVLLKADEGSGASALVPLLRAEKLQSVATDAHWVVLKVAAAGGGYKTKQWLWGETKVHYSGGAIAEFILFNASGQIIRGGTLPKYTGFIQVKERFEQTTDLGDFTA